MSTAGSRPSLRVVGTPRTPQEVHELLTCLGMGIATMREIIRLWENLLDSAGVLEEIRGLSPAEVSTALQAQRRALGGTR